MSEGVRCMWMRGGTSKGGYFLDSDLPADPALRDALLLRDGLARSAPDRRHERGRSLDLEGRDRAAVGTRRCRRRLPFPAGLRRPGHRHRRPELWQHPGRRRTLRDRAWAGRGRGHGDAGHNPHDQQRSDRGGARADLGGRVRYDGEARIDGVPGAAAPIPIAFRDTAGSTCGALLPTGNAADEIAGVAVTMIDNGMPCVILRAADMGITGAETPAELETNQALRTRLEAIRLRAGPLMNLGDVAAKSVPKMTMVSAPRAAGTISTLTFIPHRCHKSIGVLGAVSVATACLMEGTVAAELAHRPAGTEKALVVEHPTGAMTVIGHVAPDGTVARAEVLRTARKLFDGVVFPRPLM